MLCITARKNKQIMWENKQDVAPKRFNPNNFLYTNSFVPCLKNKGRITAL